MCIHNTPPGISQVIVRPFINYSVSLFLFLSGYLSSAENWKPAKRVKKVVIPYVIWTLLYTVLSYHDSLRDIPIAFIKDLLTAQASAIMYYIFVYVELTLLIPIIDRLARSRYMWIGFAISPAEIIFMRLIPMITGAEVNKYISIFMNISCLGWFTYYYLGYVIGNELINIRISKKTVAALWLIGMVLQFAEGYWQYSIGIENCGTQLKLSSILTGAYFCISGWYFINENHKQIKWLKMIGDLSFGIYFSHLAVMAVLNKVPYYSNIFFLLKVVIVLFLSTSLVLFGRKMLASEGYLLGF